MKKATRYLMLAAALLLGLAAAIAGVLLYQRWAMDVERLTQEICMLPTTTTAEKLESEGYLNLTDTQPELIKSTEVFFGKCTAGERDVLKTFTDTDGEPVIRLLWSEPSAYIISMYTYHVAGQYAEEKRTFLVWRDVTEALGTKEIWLRGHSVDASIPDGEDYMLYRYANPT